MHGCDNLCIDEIMHMAWGLGYDVPVMMYDDSAHGYTHGVHMGIWCCKHLGPQSMFRWLMTTIIVANEFVQLNKSLSLIWSYVKRGPSISIIQKGDLGF